MDRKIWIVGDSFAMRDQNRYGKNSWVEICAKYFKGDNYFVSSMGSRDIQTIFDIFLENLYKIKPDDFVILMLPTLTRFRLPLVNGHVTATYCNDSQRNYPLNYMIGGVNYTAQVTDSSFASHNEEHKKLYMLEWPLSEIDPKVFEPNRDSNEVPTTGNIMQMINSSNTFTNNWNLILKSIQSYVPFKLLYYSWENELDSSIVNTKDVITNELGIWETLQDVYDNTNGEGGSRGDSHWSTDMNIKFAEHIIKSYPQYFEYESKIL
jgi:hypothetical protein